MLRALSGGLAWLAGQGTGKGKGPQKTNCAQLWGRVGYSEKNAPSPFPIVSKGEALKSAEGPEWGVGMVSWAGHRKGEGPSKNQLFSTLE